MSEDTPNYVEAVAVKDGKILSVGTVEEVNKYKSKETKLGVSWSNCLFYFRTDADKRYNLLCLVYIFYLWVKRISYELTLLYRISFFAMLSFLFVSCKTNPIPEKAKAVENFDVNRYFGNLV